MSNTIENIVFLLCHTTFTAYVYHPCYWIRWMHASCTAVAHVLALLQFLKLSPMPPLGMYNDYLELAVQFGFITMCKLHV